MPADITFDDLPLIFAECASKEDTGYTITRPWRKGGYVYATDGHMCVRMRRRGRQTPAAQGNFPCAADLDWGRDMYRKKSVAPAPDCGCEAKYVQLLKRHGARLYLPKKRGRHTCPVRYALRFECSGSIEGLVTPMAAASSKEAVV